MVLWEVISLVYVIVNTMSNGQTVLYAVHRDKEFASQVVEQMNENLQLLDYEPNTKLVEVPLHS
jgi:hypothetical protein